MKAGWTIKELKSMSKIMYGHTAKASGDIEGPRYLRITDIQNNSVDWNEVPCCPSLKDDFEKYELNSGDIVFARTGATTGKSFLINECPEAVFASYLIRVQPDQNIIYPDFLYMFFQSPKYWNAIESGVSGSAQGGFNAKKLGNLPIPIPPLSEQKEIVAKLDEAFATIEVAKANIEKNIENAKELFQSRLNEIFSRKGDGWEEEKLGDVCNFVRGPFGGSLKKNCFKPEGYAVYEQQHAIYHQFDQIRYFIDEEKFEEMKRFELFPGDLIMSCSGTMGKVSIVPNKIKRGIINQALLKLTPTKNLNVEYLSYWMNSESFQKSIAKNSLGATIKNVASVKILKEIQIPVPSLSEQKEIVAKLDEFSIYCKESEEKYCQKLTNLEELKKSLLQKAFAGELT